MGELVVERLESVMRITIDRQERRNALDAATSAALDAAIEQAEADDTIGAAILTATGDRAFCAGMDMKEAAEIGSGHGLVPGRGFGGITQRKRRKPLIAAVNGAAVAGGFELALACDLVIAAEHALFGLTEVKRGLFAFAGGIQRLARQLPRQTALSMILRGELLPAQRLYEFGMVTEVVPSERLSERSLQIAREMLKNSWQAIQNGKALYEAAIDMPLERSLEYGMEFGKTTLDSPDSREGVAAFAEKRDKRP
jgi:enoyl-CoA hydratase/carnithine racemase